LTAARPAPTLRAVMAARQDRSNLSPDKYFERWRFVYALVALTPAHTIIAVTGTSIIPTQQLIARLQSEEAARRDTRLGRFLAEVRDIGAACYLWPLESYFGDLDEIDAIKDRWILVGQAAGLLFPQNPIPRWVFDPVPTPGPYKSSADITISARISRLRDPTPTLWRTWPDFSDIEAMGFRIL
jgi:hypothetical protein